MYFTGISPVSLQQQHLISYFFCSFFQYLRCKYLRLPVQRSKLKTPLKQRMMLLLWYAVY